MPNRETKPIGTFDSFDELFQRAEGRPGYWVELGKLEFTEEMLARMKERGVSKSQLAFRLQAKPAFVTRLVSGHNNFTLETMVRVARALDCEFRSHLQPAGTKACWIDVLKNEPQRTLSGWASEEFRKVETINPDFAHEPLTAAA
jgi:transcriptional regulator with XRE-family HTH domain